MRQSNNINITINRAKVFQFQFVAIVILLFLHVLTQIYNYYYQNSYTIFLENQFNITNEWNIPTFVTIIYWLINAALFFIISTNKTYSFSTGLKWKVLSLVFLVLAADEYRGYHELISGHLREYFNLHGIFFYAWVIPYGMVFIILSIFFFPALKLLNKDTRILFYLSAIVFLSGSIGLEMLEGWITDNGYESQIILFNIIETIEETLELIGLAILTSACLSVLVIETNTLVVNFD